MRPGDAQLLLVDDDPAAIQALSRILAPYPNKRFATNGPDALRLAREQMPDLILLDADMPGMSGFSVLAALKGDAQLAQIPVIVATGLGLPELEVAAMEQGASDFVTKPLQATQVSARVRAQLRAKEERESAQRNWTTTRGADAMPRILIVDDDAAAIQALRSSLAAVADFHYALSGEDALAQAAALLPDLVLLDIQMPGVDGFEVCRAMKADASLRHIPVVFVTRFGEQDNEMQAFELGAADFIAKPYTTAVLRARVRNLLDLKRRTDAELRLAHEQSRRLADARVAEIVAAASDGILTVDSSGYVVLINAAAGRLLGVDHHSQIGRPVDILAKAGLEGWESVTSQPLRKPLVRWDGTEVIVEASAFPIGEGAQRLVTVMLRDVGDRVRLEVESRARLEAEAANRTKTAMLSYVAHEMGNPLNGLLGLVDVMMRDRSETVPAGMQRRLDMMQECGQQLRALLRDVLDFGRLESGALQVRAQVVDPAVCVRSALAAVESLAEAASVVLRFEFPGSGTTVLADPDRLGQCLVNLLSNAVKYNRPEGEVAVEIRTDARTVSLLVRDSGLGMSEAQRLQLFEPFNRLGRDRSSTPGTGLGLLITLRLVEAMSGRIEVESEAGAGSCFVIVLPRSDGLAPNGRPASP